jgi:hypothetical protein
MSTRIVVPLNNGKRIQVLFKDPSPVGEKYRCGFPNYFINNIFFVSVKEPA